jgi:hypothetical protein
VGDLKLVGDDFTMLVHEHLTTFYPFFERNQHLRLERPAGSPLESHYLGGGRTRNARIRNRDPLFVTRMVTTLIIIWSNKVSV